jgi:Zn finger protein HypA/HybF involved in hydrogenase expression
VHEVSLVADLLAECERQAAGRPVEAIRVRHASSIDEATLRQAYAALTAGGALAVTTLEAETFEIRLTCGCGFDGPLGHDDLVSGSVAVCPSCGEVSTLKRTAELELLEVRLAS